MDGRFFGACFSVLREYLFTDGPVLRLGSGEKQEHMEKNRTIQKTSKIPSLKRFGTDGASRVFTPVLGASAFIANDVRA